MEETEAEWGKYHQVAEPGIPTQPSRLQSLARQGGSSSSDWPGFRGPKWVVPFKKISCTKIFKTILEEDMYYYYKLCPHCKGTPLEKIKAQLRLKWGNLTKLVLPKAIWKSTIANNEAQPPPLICLCAFISASVKGENILDYANRLQHKALGDFHTWCGRGGGDKTKTNKNTYSEQEIIPGPSM